MAKDPLNQIKESDIENAILLLLWISRDKRNEE